MTGKRALFIHILKTGGTSLHAMLCDALGADAVHNPRVRSVMPVSPFGGGHPVVFGHFHYVSTMREHFDWVGTILRHPVARIWSLYRHARVDPKLELHADAQLPFSEFIKHPAPQLSNWQTRQLSDWGDKWVNATAYAQARANLITMDYAVVLRHSGGVLRSVQREICAAVMGDPPGEIVVPPQIEIPHLRAATTLVDEQPSAADVRYILSRNGFDYALVKEIGGY